MEEIKLNQKTLSANTESFNHYRITEKTRNHLGVNALI